MTRETKRDIHTPEYYSALKRKEIVTQATTRMNLEDIMLSEKSQSPKNTVDLCTVPLTWGIWSSHIHRDRRRIGLPGAGKWGEGREVVI